MLRSRLSLRSWLSSRAVRVIGSIACAWLLLIGVAVWALDLPDSEHIAGYPDADPLSISRPSRDFVPLTGEFIRRRLGIGTRADRQTREATRLLDAVAASPAHGVTPKEITVAVYFDTGNYGLTGQGENTPAAGTFVDIDEPSRSPCSPADGAGTTDPKHCDHVFVRMLKGLSRYFNSRFETHNRHVHYWAYFSSAFSESERLTDATRIWERLRPFAVIDAAEFGGYNDAFDAAMAEHGVVVFDSLVGSRSSSFFDQYAPRLWSYWPSIEHWARLYATYVCTRVAPFPVKRFGNRSGIGGPNGQRRTFGIYYPTDYRSPELTEFSYLVLAHLKDCGVEVAEEATYSREGYAVDASESGVDAARAVVQFQGRVTTVLYVGTEGRFSTIADALRYYPEVVVAGNLDNDNNFIAQAQNPNVWRNAWAMTYNVRFSALRDSPGYRAYAAGSPRPDQNAGYFAREYYPDHLMMFEGIARAGSEPTAQSLSAGLHAIGPRVSASPFAPAFFFDPKDYTAVKDAAEQWWDPAGRSPSGTSNRPGCWRMTRDGRRSQPHTWQQRDDVFENPSDPCTGYDGYIKLRTA